MLDAIHAALDRWLGEPRWKQGEGSVALSYRFESEGLPVLGTKLKVEIDTREHFTVFGHRRHRFEVASRWFSGRRTRTYDLDELLGTKLRALYQRRKGRDLFDLALALRSSEVDPARVVEAFSRYMAEEENRVTRAVFERNLAQKRRDPVFAGDITPLLAPGTTTGPGVGDEGSPRPNGCTPSGRSMEGVIAGPVRRLPRVEARRSQRLVRNADGVRDPQHGQGPSLDQAVHRGARDPEPGGHFTNGQQSTHRVMHHECTKRRRNRWKRCHGMRSCATSDPSVVHGIRAQVNRYHAVRIGIRPFGTKGSQVQILSPRPSKSLKEQDSFGESFSFATPMQ